MGTILASVVIGRLATTEEEMDVAVTSAGTLLLEKRGSRNIGTLDVGVN